MEYFRCIAGEHPDWDEYRQAMRDQGKSLIRITASAGDRLPGRLPTGPGTRRLNRSSRPP